MQILFQVLGAFFTGNLIEWILHRYLLHGVGRRPRNIFSFHWLRHHRLVRRLNFRDPDYGRSWIHGVTRHGLSGSAPEVVGLITLVLLVAPVSLILPYYYCGLVFWAILYYVLHKLSHKYPNFGKTYMPWHYDHHMARNQDANWCVTFPLVDYLLRTRVKPCPTSPTDSVK